MAIFGIIFKINNCSINIFISMTKSDKYIFIMWPAYICICIYINNQIRATYFHINVAFKIVTKIQRKIYHALTVSHTTSFCVFCSLYIFCLFQTVPRGSYLVIERDKQYGNLHAGTRRSMVKGTRLQTISHKKVKILYQWWRFYLI